MYPLWILPVLFILLAWTSCLFLVCLQYFIPASRQYNLFHTNKLMTNAVKEQVFGFIFVCLCVCLLVCLFRIRLNNVFQAAVQ